MDGNDEFVQCTLDDDLGNTALVDTGIEVTADLVVFDEFAGIVFFATIPIALPSADDT